MKGERDVGLVQVKAWIYPSPGQVNACALNNQELNTRSSGGFEAVGLLSQWPPLLLVDMALSSLKLCDLGGLGKVGSVLVSSGCMTGPYNAP